MDRIGLTRKGGLLLAALAFALLAACTGATPAEEAPDATPPAADGATTDQAPQPPSEPDSDGNPAEAPATEPQPAADVNELPETTELNVTVDGETIAVPAKLTKSDQGYAFYLMEGFEFTPEEPGMDMVFHQEFGEFFLRIEPLEANADIAQVRKSTEDVLKAVGDNVVDMKDSFFDEEIRAKSEFILQAGGELGSVTMILLKVDGKPFRLTLNFPVSEGAEGVTPRFYPMIRTIVVTE